MNEQQRSRFKRICDNEENLTNIKNEDALWLLQMVEIQDHALVRCDNLFGRFDKLSDSQKLLVLEMMREMKEESNEV